LIPVLLREQYFTVPKSCAGSDFYPRIAIKVRLITSVFGIDNNSYNPDNQFYCLHFSSGFGSMQATEIPSPIFGHFGQFGADCNFKQMQVEKEIKEQGQNGSIEKLLELVAVVRPEENQIISDYILLGRSSGKKSQLNELFKLLITRQVTVPEELYTQYAELAPKTIAKMASQLREKILAALVDETNYSLPGAKSEKGVAVFGIKDLTKQVMELRSRGLFVLALDRLSEAVKLGKDYELYSDLIQLLYMKLEMLKIRSQHEHLIELEAEIDFYEQARKAGFKAEALFYEINTLLVKTANLGKHQEEILDGIKQLRDMYGQTNVSFAYYYGICLEINYYSESGNSLIAAEKALELLRFVKNKPALNGLPQLPICYLYLAQTHLPLYRFSEVLVYTNLAKEYFTPGSWNYGEATLIEFYALYYRNEFSSALAAINTLLDDMKYATTRYKAGERRYLKACCLISMGEYHEAQYELSQIYQITKDKAGWNIGLRLMNIAMSCVNKKTERMYADLVALQRDLHRIKQLTNISSRDKLVIVLLRELLKYDGDFKYVSKIRAEELALLKESQGEYIWQMFGHELIPFHLWFESMSMRRPYKCNLVEPSSIIK
jgi:HEPN domain-containing protein